MDNAIPSSADPIFDAALALPETQRLTLAARLLESMPDAPDVLSLDDPGLLEELKRRSTDAEGSVPWHQLRDEF